MNYKQIGVALIVGVMSLLVGCESMNDITDVKSWFDGSSNFGINSSALVGGGAVGGKDYIKGLSSSDAARQYFNSLSSSSASKVSVSRGNSNNTGIEWTDDGGISIPPGTTIQFSNKGYCMDPHLPAPKSGEEMQLVKTSSLIPTQLQGTYKNLLQRAANGDEEVKNNMQRLVWALRTAGSKDSYATNLTDRQKEILAECGDESGSFESYLLYHKVVGHYLESAQTMLSKYQNQIEKSFQVKVGTFTYDVRDLLDPDKAQQRVGEHLQSLVNMSKNMPVSKTGFNYGELASGIYTDIKGNGILSCDVKIANSTSHSYVYYPMDYVAQVGSGRSSSTEAYYATSDSSMRQRITFPIPQSVVSTTVETIGRSGTVGGSESNAESSSNGSGAKFVHDGNHQVDSVEDAADKFDKQIREKSDHKDGDREYYAIIYRYDDKIYMTDITGGDLTENQRTQSATMSVSMDWNGAKWSDAKRTEILSVIHSHPVGPSSDKFSMADQGFVLRGMNISDSSSGETKQYKPSLILVNTAAESGIFTKSYEKKILKPGFTANHDNLFENAGEDFD